mgnify:CR=1 FL=1
MQILKRQPKKKAAPESVRLFPAVMATGAALLGLKVFTMAESLAQTAAPADHATAASAPRLAPTRSVYVPSRRCMMASDPISATRPEVPTMLAPAPSTIRPHAETSTSPRA